MFDSSARLRTRAPFECDSHYMTTAESTDSERGFLAKILKPKNLPKNQVSRVGSGTSMSENRFSVERRAVRHVTCDSGSTEIFVRFQNCRASLRSRCQSCGSLGTVHTVPPIPDDRQSDRASPPEKFSAVRYML